MTMLALQGFHGGIRSGRWTFAWVRLFAASSQELRAELAPFVVTEWGSCFCMGACALFTTPLAGLRLGRDASCLLAARPNKAGLGSSSICGMGAHTWRPNRVASPLPFHSDPHEIWEHAEGAKHLSEQDVALQAASMRVNVTLCPA